MACGTLRPVNGGQRRWVYGGLAVAAGVGLVLAGRRGGALGGEPGRRILLVFQQGHGDGLAQGLGAPLGRLGREAGVPVSVVPLFQLPPVDATTFVLVVGVIAGPGGRVDCRAVTALVLRLRAAGATVAWVAPPARAVPALVACLGRLSVPIFPSGALRLQRGPDGRSLSVLGYAGWAGAIWRWLGLAGGRRAAVP